MRTLILSIICLFPALGEAQYMKIMHEDTSFTQNEHERATLTIGRLKPYMADDTLDIYSTNCIDDYGLIDCRLSMLAIMMMEHSGIFNPGKPGVGGPAHIQKKDVYQDYVNRMRGKPGFVDFKFEELNDPMKVRYTLILLDWHIGLKKTYGYDTEEKWVRAWNRGPSAWKDHLKRKDFQTDAEWQAHQKRARESKTYWLQYLIFKRVLINQSEIGYAHGY